jgi:hypothetical protein
LIAWLALGISAGTFIWKFIETYIRWPRIGVVIRQHVSIHVAFIVSAEAFGRLQVTREGDETPAQDDAAPEEPPHREPTPAQDSGSEDTPAQDSGSEDTFDLIVVNKGAEAMTVADVGVRSEDRSRNIDVQARRDIDQQISGPEFPARVEGHGALLWTIGPELLKEFPRGTKMVGYAYRYRSFRKYPKRWRNPLKLYETPITYFKN